MNEMALFGLLLALAAAALLLVLVVLVILLRLRRELRRKARRGSLPAEGHPRPRSGPRGR